MINRQALLSDLQALLKRLEADLLERSESAEVPEVGRTLRAEYERARQAERTAANYEDWRSDAITQAAAAWVLSCVFVRFLEDNRLIDPPKVSGQSAAVAGHQNRLQRARDEHELFFRAHPKLNDRDYLLAVFDELAELPGTREVFGEHNPIRELPNWLSGDAGGELLRFFQKIDANTGVLIHDFTDPQWDTRFLGDLYQDLSKAARKKYALLQTPEFVEEFILERTLEPALNEFGLDGFRMIDPACGSGHFLLGSFRRILQRWQKSDPGTNVRVIVQRTLDSIHGVDLNPYAVAIARFRLLLVAMKVCGLTRLGDDWGFRFNLVCGDSLLHGVGAQASFGWHDFDHVYQTESQGDLTRILKPGYYHAVVANPPYITPKDKAQNDAYRERYSACHRQYSLAVPFMQRLFQLAQSGHLADPRSGGFVGQITANSFMKREFGKKLIEEYFAGRGGSPGQDLTHVIDTSGAYIPGHGTPTVILFGRHRAPVARTIRTVMGIRGEPSTPDDPAQGLVWMAITRQIDQPGSQSDFVSVGDSPRQSFHKHPWSIGGGGAAELKDYLDENAAVTLNARIETISAGICITREDDAYLIDGNGLARNRISSQYRIASVQGEHVRDWMLHGIGNALFPYDEDLRPVDCRRGHHVHKFLWPYKEPLWRRKELGGDHRELGRTWWEWNRFLSHRFAIPLSITYGEVASHNHFVFDRGGKIFNRTAPVIKLPPEATEDDHLALLGLLNSSTACFWMKQVCHQKQMMGGDGIRIESKAKVPYAFNSTQLGRLPIPASWTEGSLRESLLEVTRAMEAISREYAGLTGRSVLQTGPHTVSSIRSRWSAALRRRGELRSQQVTLQEEIDFVVYCMFGLVDAALLAERASWPNVMVTEGDRPFCIVDGSNEDAFAVPSVVPAGWPEGLRDLWQRRIEAIRSSRDLRLIESSMYKRRWIGRQGLFNLQRTDDELGDAARSWLLDCLESYFDFDGRMNEAGKATAKLDVAVATAGRLADVARQDPDFMQVGELYRDDPAFDVERLVSELVERESVPLLPVLRYKPSGLRKRAEWERTWDVQRAEDETGNRLDIPVPPKYESKDFLKSDYNRLRGKLDVPKERWVSFPHCEGSDGTLVIAWAGYDHLQLARSISAYYVDIQEHLGGRDDPRLVPLLACLLELLPWLKQWHNEVDPEFGERMGDYFQGFVNEEARQLGKTVPEIKAWQPPQRAGGRKKKQ